MIFYYLIFFSININEMPKYSWVPLNKKWQLILRSNNFREKECNGDGNCQFRSIAQALSNAGFKHNHKKLRQDISKYIYELPQDQFELIINNYRFEIQSGDFQGNWDPLKVQTRYDFAKHLKKSGNHFQGDNITMSLLSQVLKIDFIVFDTDYNITDLSNNDSLNDTVILLFYIKGNNNSGHYKTLGLINNKNVQTIFLRSNLPFEIQQLFNKQLFFENHIKDYINSNSPQDVITLHSITHYLKDILTKNFTLLEKKIIMRLALDIFNNNLLRSIQNNENESTNIIHKKSKFKLQN